MPSYTIQNIADAMGVNYDTAQRHILRLKKEGVFHKNKMRKLAEKEAEQLSELLGFKMDKLKAN